MLHHRARNARGPHPIDGMLRMAVNRPLPACGFAGSAAGEEKFKRRKVEAASGVEPLKIGQEYT